jgi:uncharacterized protein (DUF427 family)
MNKTLGPSPGALKYPHHSVAISEDDGHWTVTVNGTQVADSRSTLAVDETDYERVNYFPVSDVKTELLEESLSRSTCPFKGEAHYLAVEIDGKTQDIGWFYPSVYDEVAPIAGYVAFYADRVTVAPADNRA